VEHICCRLFRLAVPQWFHHGSVSTSRSSNRTCGFPASGSRTRHHAVAHGRADDRPTLPSLRHAVPPAALEPWWADRLSPVARSVAASCTDLELRPLPSTGITRLRRYYGPLRHPARPSLTLTGYRLEAVTLHRAGLPVLQPVSSYVHAAATTPAGPLGASLVSPSVIGLPRISGGSAPASPFSRPAQSAVRRIAACTFAESPCDPFPRRFQPFRCLHVCSDCYWQERQLPGGTHSR
jgi:hypothetical protein